MSLFHPDYAEPVDTTTQVARMPGTADAPCLCREPSCVWPFCCPTDEEDTRPRLRRREWRVDTCSLEQAQTLITDEHYAGGTANTATFRHGLYRRNDWPLTITGAALWIPPTRAAAEATTNGDWRRVLALSRLALRPDAPVNAASFLIGASVRLIASTGNWDVLVTYADEWQGHTGAFYRATNWEYRGLTKPERTYVLNGRMIARKAGPNTRTHQEMLDMGAVCVGSFAKHKFVKVLRPPTDKEDE